MSKAEAAGPTTTPAWEAAATRLRARAVCGPLTMSVAADCATGIDAAKTPAHSRPMRMPVVEPEAAMRRLEAVAPVRQTRRMIARPTRLERLTRSGQQIIWATEKHEVARPHCSGVAPSVVMCSGRLEMAMPSPSICAKTLSVIGSSVRGSGSVSAARSLSAAFMSTGRQRLGSCSRGATSGRCGRINLGCSGVVSRTAGWLTSVGKNALLTGSSSSIAAVRSAACGLDVFTFMLSETHGGSGFFFQEARATRHPRHEPMTVHSSRVGRYVSYSCSIRFTWAPSSARKVKMWEQAACTFTCSEGDGTDLQFVTTLRTPR